MSAQIKPGHTYKVMNAQARTVLDLTMADFKSVTGAPWDNSDNQKVCSRHLNTPELQLMFLTWKWVAERARSTPQTPGTTRWTFRSVATGLYLGVEGAPRTAARIMATRDETEWDVRADREDPTALRYAHLFSPGFTKARWLT